MDSLLGFSAAWLGTYPTDKSLTTARREEALAVLLVCACACASARSLFACLILPGIPLAVSVVCAALSPVTDSPSGLCPVTSLSLCYHDIWGHPQQLILFFLSNYDSPGAGLFPPIHTHTYTLTMHSHYHTVTHSPPHRHTHFHTHSPM